MPIGLLITVALVAVATLSCLMPRRLGILGPLRLYLGHVNEIPFIAILWLVGSTWAAISQGDTYSLFGWLVVALAALATAGLIVVISRSMPTGRVIRRALEAGLGAGWAGRLDGADSARLHRVVSFPALFGPVFIRRRHVRRTANIPYGSAPKNRLDVYVHRSRPTNSPVLVYFHGGMLMRGSKNYQGLPLLYQLASQGWVCITANYRLSPSATFPDHLIDVKRAIAWTRTHGQEYGADPDLVFVAGSSSGAQLAALAALTANDAELQPGFEQADTSVAAAMTLYGDYDWLDSPDRAGFLAPVMKSSPIEDPAAWARASPISHLRVDAPPFFVIHGDQDVTLPVENARRFAHELRCVSNSPVVYAELPGAQHIFDMFRSIRGDAVDNGIAAFVGWVRNHGGQGPRDEA